MLRVPSPAVPPTHRTTTWPLFVHLLLLLLLLTTPSSADPTTFTFHNCTVPATPRLPTPLTLSSLTASTNSVAWGVSLNTTSQPIEAYVTALGPHRIPVVINLYFDTQHLGGRNDPLNCQIAAAGAAGSVVMLTLEPWLGLSTINTTTTSQLAALAEEIQEAGIPLLLRFAHEMNGGWYPWGSQPAAYRRAFRDLALAVHKQAPKTGMVWAPNTGVGYPYLGAGNPLPTKDPELDTNGDGRVDSADDPFSPYYPGDDVVDWVGVSLYSKRAADVLPAMANVALARGKMQMYIDNPGAGFDLYTTYSAGKNKPFMIAETASAWYPEFPTGDGEVAVKRGWWAQLWAEETLTKYPLLRVVVWFEFMKRAETGEMRDYTLTGNPAVLNAFVDDVGKTGSVSFLDAGKEMVRGDGGCTTCGARKNGAGGRVLAWGLGLRVGVLVLAGWLL